VRTVRTTREDLIHSFLRFIHAVLRGRWPKNLAFRSLRKSAKNPQTFGEHIRYKMAFERNPLRAQVSDKLLVRNYISEKVGTEYLNKLYSQDVHPRKLFEVDLPSEFVLKVNHGSGGSIIVRNDAPTDNPLPAPNRWMGWKRFQVKPESFSSDAAIKLLDYWLTLDYSYWAGRYPEWNYSEINRMALAEELLISQDSSLPADYRFYTFHGETKIIGLDSTYPDGSKSIKHFMPDWTPIDVSLQAGRKILLETKNIPHKPQELELMKELAFKLGQDFDWIRVDMYLINGHIYIGELTNFPTAGQGIYRPKFLDYYLGHFFKV